MKHAIKASDIDSVTKNSDGSFNITLKQTSNGYRLFTTDWTEIPRFDSKGNPISPEVFKEQQVETHGLIHFMQNYGNEFIGSSYTLVNSDALKTLKGSPVLDTRDGKLKIYKYPEPQHKYICAIDTAKDGNDEFALQILDITNIVFEQVAVANIQVDYLLMPEYIDSWCRDYNNAFLIIENNEGSGQSIADQMYRNYEYENLYFDTDIKNHRKRYPGFRTTAKTRSLTLKTMKTFLENSKLILNDQNTINQLFTFILINNKYQADEGCKDDLVMSLAISFAPFCNVKNFEDLKEIVKILHTDDEPTTDTSFADMLVISNFDDTTDESIERPFLDDETEIQFLESSFTNRWN